MAEIDRAVRSTAFRMLMEGAAAPSPTEIGARAGLAEREVSESLRRLSEEHRLVLSTEGDRVEMAHPFSGVSTDYQSVVGEQSWWANCGWDAFAILGLLGDGMVLARSANGKEMAWSVSNGVVSPEGLVHFLVPPSRFWDDIAFT